MVNKIDSPKLPDDFYDFYELGLGEPIPISAANMYNLGDVLDLIVEKMPRTDESEEDDTTKIAVIASRTWGNPP